MVIPTFTDGTVLYAAQLNQLGSAIPTKVSNLTNDLGFITTASTVTSVAGRTGAVALAYTDVSGLSTVAHTGAYADLLNLPTIPTNTNQLTNGSGFITNASLSTYATLLSPAFTGIIGLNGAVTHTTAVVTSGSLYSVLAADYYVIINKTSGSATAVVLPSSPVTGRTIFVKDGKGDALTNNITVTPAAGTIDGASSQIINQNYGSVQFIYNGTSWSIV